MKKILLSIIAILFFTAANADVKGQALSKASEKISSTIGNLIPGEGLTEVDIIFKDNAQGKGNYEYSILGVRDILSKENTNLFTQFSLHNQDVNGDKRAIGNLGIGYRFLNSDQSMMFGANTFYDQDLSEKHKRVGFGLEASAAMLDFNFNEYRKATNVKVISGTAEQALSGRDINLTSQIPYMPWAAFNYNSYYFEAEKAAQDLKGDIYSLEMDLNPSLGFDLSKDNSSVNGADDVWSYKLTFVYPPKDDKPTLLDGVIAPDMFVKQNMKSKLKDKVRRENNIVIETQGTLIITKG